jgi:hypothetical protein
MKASAWIARHDGVSFVPGIGLVHFRASDADEELLRRRWEKHLTVRGLAGEVTLEHEPEGVIHGCAAAYVFLPRFLIRSVIESEWEPDDVRDKELGEQLELLAFDCHSYLTSYGLHYRVAQFRRWVAMPFLMGRQPALYIGTGRFSRLLTMNVDQSVAAPIVFAGSDKLVCRSFLASQGFPVAPGAAASSPSGAVARALEIGFPVALKKAGVSGNSEGVILGIATERDCIDAATELLASGQLLIVEKMIDGVELRIHFVNGRLFRVLRSEALSVTGDGTTSLAGLLARDAPAHFKAMSRTAFHRRRLILQVYRLGVREWADLERVAPGAGERVRVSAAAGGPNMEKLAADALHPDDRAAIEALLARYGSPSAGVDVMLRAPGARLNEGGAIIEINVPCGFGYLGDEAARAADLEVLEAARRSPGFVAAGGRVPLEIAVADDFPDGSQARAGLVERFSKRHKGARVATLTGERGWMQILTDTSASAFLIFVDEAAIEEHGMPVNLQPAVRISRAVSRFSARNPRLFTTAMNAGCTLVGNRASMGAADLGYLIAKGESARAVEVCRRELKQKKGAAIHSGLLLSMHFLSGFSPEEIFEAHRLFAKRYEAPLVKNRPAHTNSLDPERRLRVGYVSNDFKGHLTAKFLRPVLANLNRQQFDLFLYSSTSAEDDVTREFQRIAGDGWRNIVDLSDDEVANRIREDSIDVLVDIAGHTAGNTMLAFARKPAPVQVAWLGYPDTTGLRAMDYRITDALADPPGMTEHLHSETLIRLPCFLSYTLPEGLPEVSSLPFDRNGAVTFGSFNNFMKMSPGTIECWARILKRVPGSKLMLKHMQSGDAGSRDGLRRLFERHGVEGDRIVILPWAPSHALHLSAYRNIDLALDTFPYHGTTTTCDALSMAVPVVTMAGKTHVSRVGVTLLTQVGLTDWITSSEDEYVERAVEYAGQPALLRQLRGSLRARLEASELGHPDGFARSMEGAWRRIWRAYCAGHGQPERVGSPVTLNLC